MNTEKMSIVEIIHYLWGNENPDWRDKFFDFDSGNVSISGQVNDKFIEILVRDIDTGVMVKIAGDNVSDLHLEVK